MNTLEELKQLLEESIHLDFNNNIENLISTLKSRITVNNMISEFGVEEPKNSYSTNPCNIPLDYSSNIRLVTWCENYSISWPDNGQPEVGEKLLCISFPTGAYILHKEYPKNSFDKMFAEFMTFEPKYWDSHNHGLWFDSSKSKAVFKAFPKLMSKYREEAVEEAKQKAIDKLKAEIAKLEEN